MQINALQDELMRHKPDLKRVRALFAEAVDEIVTHMRLEEEDVFPDLERLLPTEERPIERLREEHKVLMTASAQVAEDLSRNDLPGRTLDDTVAFVRLYRLHTAIEEWLIALALKSRPDGPPPAP